MKTITTTTPVRKADASLDAKLNPVELGSKQIVSWAEAFPRSGPSSSRQLAVTGTLPATELPPPVWRTDATVGSVLSTVSRLATTPSSD